MSKKSRPNISLGTVYRNLNQLVAQGVVRRIATPTSGDRFDCRIDPHAHLMCSCCGRVFDLEDGLLLEIDRNVLATTGFLVNDRQLLLRGLCADCLLARGSISPACRRISRVTSATFLEEPLDKDRFLR